MIFDILLVPIMALFNWFFSLFPSIELNSELVSSVSKLFNTFATTNRYFPVNELFWCLTILFIAFNFNFIVYCINWLLNKILELIPFIG